MHDMVNILFSVLMDEFGDENGVCKDASVFM